MLLKMLSEEFLQIKSTKLPPQSVKFYNLMTYSYRGQFRKAIPFTCFLPKHIYRKGLPTTEGSRTQYWKTLENVLLSVHPTPVGSSKCLDLWNSQGAPWTCKYQGETEECRTFESQQKLCAKRWQPSKVRRSPSDISSCLLLPNLLS